MTKPLNNMPHSSHDKNQRYDALIIGQGLAGSLLAWEMIQQGQRVMVLDDQHHGSSSKIAAGIINPITGHRINLTNRFSEYIHSAKNTYQQLYEQLPLPTPLISEVPQQRLIKNPGQKSYFEQRLRQTEYRHFLQSASNLSSGSETSKPNKADNNFFRSAEYGVADILQTYRVDTLSLLNHSKQWLKQHQAFIETKVDYDKVSIQPQEIQYFNNDITLSAKHIIFCEGFQAIHNPWLKGLPFKLAKGEILTLEIEKICPSMMNWGQWLLPNEDSKLTAKLGASYTWDDTSLTTDPDIAKTLLASLEKNSLINAKLLSHQAGIRPTTVDRKPLIGVHPKYDHLYCFNGFGSKGCLTIPHYAKKLASHFSGQTPLSILFPELSPTLSFKSNES